MLRTERVVTMVERDEDTVTLRATVRLFFEPQGPVSVEVHVEGKVGIPEGTSEKEVKAVMGEIAGPILSEASLVVAFLTKEMDLPVVISPPIPTKKP